MVARRGVSERTEYAGNDIEIKDQNDVWYETYIKKEQSCAKENAVKKEIGWLVKENEVGCWGHLLRKKFGSTFLKALNF